MKDGIKALNCHIKKEIYDMLKAYCREYGTSMRFVVEKSLQQYIEAQYRKEKKAISPSQNQN